MASLDTISLSSLESSKELAIAWMCANGGTILPASREPGHMVHVPFSLLPRPFPRSMYEQAVSLAAPFNALVDAVARDTEWLVSTLRQTGTSDPFTGRLLDLLELVLAEEGGPRQAWALGLHRSDYMVDRGRDGAQAPALRQIELNTISASFGALSCTVGRLHLFLLHPEHGALIHDACTRDIARAYGAGTVAPVPQGLDAAALAAGLAAAVSVYPPTTLPARPLCLLYVVQPAERNVMDQRKVELALRQETGGRVTVRRITLGEVTQRCRLDMPGAGALLYRARAGAGGGTGGAGEGAGARAQQVEEEEVEEEVAVVYFRAGYTPEDHPVEDAWAARALIERSCAIKCPSVAYHLAGSKKVQQVLAAPGVLERFVTNAGDARNLRACFAGLWSLDPAERDASSAAAIATARADPSGYVMKPQREGGGNNVYGEAVAKALAGPEHGGLDDEALAGYILMERVYPSASPACFVRATEHAIASALSELGIFGVFLGDGKTVRVNQAAGHLLRTKVANSDEGGVAAGFAVLDTPFLTDE